MNIMKSITVFNFIEELCLRRNIKQKCLVRIILFFLLFSFRCYFSMRHQLVMLNYHFFCGNLGSEHSFLCTLNKCNLLKQIKIDGSPPLFLYDIIKFKVKLVESSVNNFVCGKNALFIFVYFTGNQNFQNNVFTLLS